MLLTNRLRPSVTPWNLFHQVQQDINRELADWFSTAASRTNTSLGVWTKDDQALVIAELPGFDLDKIDVSVHRDVLMIEARPSDDTIPEQASVLRRERSREGVRRQLQLPFELDPQRIEATYENGRLIVRLTAHESAHPAKIEVKAG